MPLAGTAIEVSIRVSVKATVYFNPFIMTKIKPIAG
jgi:hypothetical protein